MPWYLQPKCDIADMQFSLSRCATDIIVKVIKCESAFESGFHSTLLYDTQMRAV